MATAPVKFRRGKRISSREDLVHGMLFSYPQALNIWILVKNGDNQFSEKVYARKRGGVWFLCKEESEWDIQNAEHLYSTIGQHFYIHHIGCIFDKEI